MYLKASFRLYSVISIREEKCAMLENTTLASRALSLFDNKRKLAGHLKHSLLCSVFLARELLSVQDRIWKAHHTFEILRRQSMILLVAS